MKRGYMLAVLFVCSTLVGYGQMKDTLTSNMVNGLSELVHYNSKWPPDTLSTKVFAVKFVVHSPGKLARIVLSDGADTLTRIRINNIFKSDFNWKEVYTAAKATDTLNIIIPFLNRYMNGFRDTKSWDNGQWADAYFKAMSFPSTERYNNGLTIILPPHVAGYSLGACKFGR